jgi:hypothetical protein
MVRTRLGLLPMSDTEMLERIRELRSRGRTPKEIARATGLRPAELAPLIRAVAATLLP